MASRGRGGVHVRKPKGRTYYTARFWIEGVEHNVGTGRRDREGAIRVAEAIREERIKATPTTASELKELCLHWLVDIKALRSERWVERLRDMVDRLWLPRWQRLEHITSASLQSYITERSALVSPMTVLKELSGLNVFLKWCLHNKHITSLPVWVPPKRSSDFKPVCLTEDEVKRLLENMGGGGRDFIEFMWETGLRYGTVASIEWRDVDLGAKTLHVRGSIDKCRYDRVVPLSAGAVAVLRRQPAGAVSDKIFRRGDYRRAIRTAAVKIGRPKGELIGTHAFRHSRSTDLGGKTTNVLALQYLLGHKSMETTRKYLHGGFEKAKELLDGGSKTKRRVGRKRATAKVRREPA